MSATRSGVVFSSTALNFLRAAVYSSSVGRPLSSSCLRLPRNFRPGQSSFRRGAATASAYRPDNFDTTPPPRNIDIPETSIAGGEYSSRQAEGARSPPAQTQLSEGDAQKPLPMASTTGGSSISASQTSPENKPRRTSRLRPRKAAMTLSSGAVQQLRELLELPEPKLIRVGVKNRGCSGLAYNLEYVEKPGAFDETVDQDGVKVLIDSKALFSIIGSEMDWVEDKLSRRFVFRNPNISKSDIAIIVKWILDLIMLQPNSVDVASLLVWDNVTN